MKGLWRDRTTARVANDQPISLSLFGSESSDTRQRATLTLLLTVLRDRGPFSWVTPTTPIHRRTTQPHENTLNTEYPDGKTEPGTSLVVVIHDGTLRPWKSCSPPSTRSPHSDHETSVRRLGRRLVVLYHCHTTWFGTKTGRSLNPE